jgi:hypothetical protein
MQENIKVSFWRIKILQVQPKSNVKDLQVYLIVVIMLGLVARYWFLGSIVAEFV